ncbi:tapasin [Rhynchocyon petersi]
MKLLSVFLTLALGLATDVSAGPAALDCWFVEDLGGGSLAKRPAVLLLRQVPGGPPPRPDLDPKLYLSVHDPTGALQAAFRRYPRGVPAPHCEMSRYVPLPTSAYWAKGLTPEHSCPRALDGSWFMVSMSSSVLSLSILLQPQSESPQEPVLITMATVVLTVLTRTPAPRIQLGQDAVLDLSFAYWPPTHEAAKSLALGPPPFGLEWRRQHQGKGHLLLAATPGLTGQMPEAKEGSVTYAAWDDDEPWGPWTGNGTLKLPTVQPFQEGTYLATVHLPYLQGQVSLELSVYKPPKVSLTPAPLVWAAPGEAPPQLLCLVSHFYPSEGLEVEWELRGGPEGGFQKAEGQRWLSSLRHHSDGSVSLSGHLQPPPVTTEQHGMRYACRIHHPSLPASGRSAQVTLEVAGLSGPSLEDGVGLFLSAFLLLGLIKTVGWVGEYEPFPTMTLYTKIRSEDPGREYRKPRSARIWNRMRLLPAPPPRGEAGTEGSSENPEWILARYSRGFVVGGWGCRIRFPPFFEGWGREPIPVESGSTRALRSQCRGPELLGPGPPCPALPESAALAPVLTSFPFWLLLSERADAGGSGKGGRAWEPGGGGCRGGAEKPRRGFGLGPETDGDSERPGTRAAPAPPEQVRARAPWIMSVPRTPDPLSPQTPLAFLPACPWTLVQSPGHPGVRPGPGSPAPL